MGDDTIESMASFSNNYDCESGLYINKLFISKEALHLMSHYFIEEQYVQGYESEIPKDKFTIIPKHISDTETAQLMIDKIIEIEKALNKKK